MSVVWQYSLAEFNKGRPHYLLPRKGTPEHQELIKIYEKNKKKYKNVPLVMEKKETKPKRKYERKTPTIEVIDVKKTEPVSIEKKEVKKEEPQAKSVKSEKQLKKERILFEIRNIFDDDF